MSLSIIAAQDVASIITITRSRFHNAHQRLTAQSVAVRIAAITTILLLQFAQRCSAYIYDGSSVFAGDRYYNNPKIDSPCHYPKPQDEDFMTKCNMHKDIVKREYQQHIICDAFRAFSLTEAEEISKALDEISLKHMSRDEKKKYCICKGEDPEHSKRYCWYKFGVAFVRDVTLPEFTLAGRQSTDLCNSTYDLSLSKDELYIFWGPQQVSQYAHTFAHVVRERWKLGNCGEDILLLVVKRRPKVLSDASKTDVPKPMLVVSIGAEVEKRVLRHGLNKFLDGVNYYNARLEQGYSVESTLKKYLADLSELLTRADRDMLRPLNKNHVPKWAIAVFAGCFVLLGIMGLGSYLVKSNIVRRTSRSQSGDSSGRKWKAGFVGGMFDFGKSTTSHAVKGGSILKSLSSSLSSSPHQHSKPVLPPTIASPRKSQTFLSPFQTSFVNGTSAVLGGRTARDSVGGGI